MGIGHRTRIHTALGLHRTHTAPAPAPAPAPGCSPAPAHISAHMHRARTHTTPRRTAQQRTATHTTAQHHTTPLNTAQHRTTPHNTAQHRTAPRNMTQYNAALRRTAHACAHAQAHTSAPSSGMPTPGLWCRNTTCDRANGDKTTQEHAGVYLSRAPSPLLCGRINTNPTPRTPARAESRFWACTRGFSQSNGSIHSRYASRIECTICATECMKIVRC